MGAQRQTLFRFRAEILHQPRPKQPGRAQLGDLHEEIHANGEKERQSWSEGVDVEPGLDPRAHIFDAIGQCVAKFEIGGGAGFLHVIAGDRNRVELRHILAGVGENVRDDAHRRKRRINISIAHHEFFKNVVLNRAGELVGRDALLLRRDNEQSQHRQHGAVHGHRDAHLIERNAVEQRAHVVDRVDGDSGHADVAGNARMIRIVAAMRREIESDRETFLARREIAAIEGVGVFGGGKAGVLADRPGLGDIHGGVGAAHERRDAGIGVDEAEAVDVRGTIEILHLDALGRQPVTPLRLRGLRVRWSEGSLGEVGNGAHRFLGLA